MLTVQTKYRRWQYENEWRIIEFEKGQGEYLFPPEILDGIILGSEISDFNREQILLWFSKYDHHVEIFQAKPKDAEYGIELEKIN